MSTTNSVPKSLLETTLNTRDLGGYRSRITEAPLKAWQILRSDIQNYPSKRDLQLLQQKNICTIIDLRGEKDVQRKPSGFAGRSDFDYHNIPIDEGSGIPASTDEVSESYMRIAQSRHMPQVFHTIAAADTGVMVNCTAGKDRTGVVSAVLLGLCGVSESDIVQDYMLTKPMSKERFDQIHKNFPEIDMRIVIPSEQYMIDFLHRLLAKYGTFPNYLQAIGVVESDIARLVHRLV